MNHPQQYGGSAQPPMRPPVKPRRKKKLYEYREFQVFAVVAGLMVLTTMLVLARFAVGIYRQANQVPVPAMDENLALLQDVGEAADEMDSAETDPTMQFDTDIVITVDVEKDVHPISPLIYGLSGAEVEYMQEVGATINSWGGNPSTRYNWRVGNAWNAGRDWEYRNVNYTLAEGSQSDRFLREQESIGAEARMSIPTLGWVAKDANTENCSFPNRDGTCDLGRESSCDNPRNRSEPELTSVRSTPEDIREWMEHIRDSGLPLRFIAMDNEPELWGYTHYDVHPDCTNYAEILDKYLTYATVVRDVFPDTELTGPTTCCWNYYWDSPAGRLDKLKHNNQDFIPWFLDSVREHDEAAGVRTLDVLDIHYYPAGLYLEGTDPETSLHRLRGSASLWNPAYTDESWISQPIFLIPRMMHLIDQHYPGTKLGISEWNFGADDTMNGALAIADVLGVFGKFELYFANYWMFPERGTPGYYAFKLFGNYDDNGGRFGDTSVFSETDDPWVVSFSALDSETGNLHMMILNKKETESAETTISLENFAADNVNIYRYASGVSDEIVHTTLANAQGEHFPLTLPAYSITHVVIEDGS